MSTNTQSFDNFRDSSRSSSPDKSAESAAGTPNYDDNVLESSKHMSVDMLRQLCKLNNIPLKEADMSTVDMQALPLVNGASDASLGERQICAPTNSVVDRHFNHQQSHRAIKCAPLFSDSSTESNFQITLPVEPSHSSHVEILEPRATQTPSETDFAPFQTFLSALRNLVPNLTANQSTKTPAPSTAPSSDLIPCIVKSIDDICKKLVALAGNTPTINAEKQSNLSANAQLMPQEYIPAVGNSQTAKVTHIQATEPPPAAPRFITPETVDCHCSSQHSSQPQVISFQQSLHADPPEVIHKSSAQNIFKPIIQQLLQLLRILDNFTDIHNNLA